ncbi:phenylalanine--tRNA ligase subunit beta [Candidatus Saccharibacteria bacterium]|nr:phenylalanine--tRNA ligase subunit beta [Candidatus Saccharibacteria bacterium]
MKIVLNWLKKYVAVPESVSDEELIRLIGARLVEVEGVIDETHKYDNIYIVRVEKAEKIPETHLTLCQINSGGDDLMQVVCGAPNVREGMLAVWIAPGAIVPASVHEDAPFVIGKRKMQGYESNGMLAGADELDFGDDHSGIVEIDPEAAQPGDLLAEVFDLKDLVLEIENKSLTHRPDCFGMIGFAREVAGILGERMVDDEMMGPVAHSLSGAASPRPVVTSEARSSSPCQAPEAIRKNNEFHPSIIISDSGICSRYSVVVLEKHGEMEKKYLTWMDTVLSKSGMKPISPVVDATNYLMLLTGQPLHAFDYDKFIEVGKTERPEIVVRLARKGEKLVLLDDKEIELNENDIVICSGDVPVALAGAMGGKTTGIDENTRNIILESATFSLFNLRKTQMAHGIFTEAITRFTKGQPPYQTMMVAKDCAEMLSGGFKVIGGADEYPNPEQPIVVKVTTDEINQLLGTDYDDTKIGQTLENVGFQVKEKGGQLEVHVPEWRTDIHIKEDIIEEVGRLLGYDNIEPTLPLHGTAEKNRLLELKKQIRRTLARYGANEVLTYSFVSGRLLEKAGQDVKKSYKIINSISPDLQYVRQSIVPSLLDKAYVNQKMPVDKFAMFEINEVYSKTWGMNDENVPVAKVSLGFVLAERKNNETAFYKAKKYAAKLLQELNIPVEFVPKQSKLEAGEPFEPVRTADIMVGGQCIGVVGEFKNSVRNEFKLAPYLAGFEIVDIDTLLTNMSDVRKIKFGSYKTEDLTVTTEKSYAETLKEVQAKYPEAEIMPLSIYQALGQKTKNLSFRIKTW